MRRAEHPDFRVKFSNGDDLPDPFDFENPRRNEPCGRARHYRHDYHESDQNDHALIVRRVRLFPRAATPGGQQSGEAPIRG
jgi:hypothetical protein